MVGRAWQDRRTMPAKMIRLRYAGNCACCAEAVLAGTKAWWDEANHRVTCVACQVGRVDDGEAPVVVPAVSAAGVAGGSARQEFERRHARRAERLDVKWGHLAGVVKFLSDDPQSTTAWAKGSEGERRLAAHLRTALGERAVLLHDRKVPGTRGNIDHLAVAASGSG
jgi:Nuclease-related domain